MFRLLQTPALTDVRAIKAFLKDKTIRWRVREGYFETFFPGEMKILLIPSEKCLVLYFLNTDASIRWVEIWDLTNFTTLKPSYNMKVMFFSENLCQLGMKLLDLSVRLPDFSKSHPLKLVGALKRPEFYKKYPQIDHPWALLEINGDRYLAQWSVLTRVRALDRPHSVRYFQLFLTPPLPVDFQKVAPVPYYHTTRNLIEIQVHYPTKKKDRGKPKELHRLPALEKIYGYHLIEFELTDRNSTFAVMSQLRANWQEHIAQTGGIL
jgi:hypothetical protein